MIGVLAWSVIGHTSESSLEQKSPFIFPIYFYTTPSAHKRKVFREETFNSERSFQKKSTLCKDFSEILWNCARCFSEGFPTHRSGNGPFLCLCFFRRCYCEPFPIFLKMTAVFSVCFFMVFEEGRGGWEDLVRECERASTKILFFSLLLVIVAKIFRVSL